MILKGEWLWTHRHTQLTPRISLNLAGYNKRKRKTACEFTTMVFATFTFVLCRRLRSTFWGRAWGKLCDNFIMQLFLFFWFVLDTWYSCHILNSRWPLLLFWRQNSNLSTMQQRVAGWKMYSNIWNRLGTNSKRTPFMVFVILIKLLFCTKLRPFNDKS